MIEYIAFFGLLLAGLLAFILFPKAKFEVRNRNPKETTISGRHKCESYIERRLYDALTSRGHSVTTQVPCGVYRIDLALMGQRIAIECDGKDYHSSPAQKARDRRKDAYLKQNGWKVMRFSGRQINGELAKVLKRIGKECSNVKTYQKS